MRPEEVIRRYLDDHGGSIDAHVDHLLVTFEVQELTPETEVSIAAALEEVGVCPDPPLGQVGPDGRVSLRVTDGNGTRSAGRSDREPSPSEVRELTALFGENGGGAREDRPLAPSPESPSTPEVEISAEAEATQLADVESELTELRERLAATESELEGERERARSLAQRLESLEQAHAELSGDLERERSEHGSAIRRLGDALVAVLELRGPVASAREDFESARQEYEGLSATLSEAERRLEQAETTAAEVRGRALDKRTRRAELERTLRAVTNAQREAEETAGRQREKLARLGPRLELARTEARRLVEQATEYERRLEAARARAAAWAEREEGEGTTEQELRQLREAEVTARRDAEVRGAEAHRLDAAVADARSRLARFEEAAAEKRAELERQRSELARLEAKDPDAVRRKRRYEPPRELRAEVEQLRADVDGARTSLESERARLRQAEQRLSRAQEALEEEVAHEATHHGSASRPG